jgi:hypothetical protein
MTLTKKTGALALAAALALPAGAQAHRGDDDARSDKTRSEHRSGSDDHRSGHRDRHRSKHGSGHRHHRSRAFVAGGTFVSFTEPSLAVSVTSGNRHAKRYFRSQAPEGTTFTLPSQQTFTLTDATRVKFDKRITDVTGDGTVDFADLAQGTEYRVLVLGKVAKTTESSTAPAIKKVYVKLPRTEEPAATEQGATDDRDHKRGKRS